MTGRRTAGLALAAGVLLGAGPAIGQVAPILRGGEHADFTRIVLPVPPGSNWTLRTGERSATLSVTGLDQAASTARVFDRIPRRRLAAVETAVEGATSRVTLHLNCDCPVSAMLVDGRYLALDIGDPDILRPHPAPARRPAPPPQAAPETPLSAATLGLIEESLTRQIERAAAEGLITLVRPDPAPPPAAQPAAEAGTAGDSSGSDPGAVLPPLREAPAEPPRLQASAPAAEPAQDRGGQAGPESAQMRITSVLDPVATIAERRPPSDPACLSDGALALVDPRDGPFWSERARLEAGLLAEFDAVQRDRFDQLIRLHLGHGLGHEALALAAAFPEAASAIPHLVDLAAIVAGRPVAPDGPILSGVDCAGAHRLWQIIGGAPPGALSLPAQTEIENAFAALPPSLRLDLGPGLVAVLLEAGLDRLARRIHGIAGPFAEAGAHAGMTLAAARLALSAGQEAEAEALLGRLVVADDPEADIALEILAGRALDAGAVPDASMRLDLSSRARRLGDTAPGPALRRLAARSEARAGDPGRGLAMLAEQRRQETDPAALDATDAAIQAVLADSALAEAHFPVYAAAVLENGALIADDPAWDATRVSVARHLLAGGLGSAAAPILEPAAMRGFAGARPLLARLYLAQGRPEAAEAALDGEEGPAIALLRARVALLRGDQAAAAEALAEAASHAPAAPTDPAADAQALATPATPPSGPGTTEEIGVSDLAFPAGYWDGVGVDQPARRAALARYMQAAEGRTPARDPEGPPAAGPETAFATPPDAAGAASLGHARAVLGQSRQVEDYARMLLEGDR